MSLEYSPFAYEIHEDPYPIYRRLRDEAPLYRNDEVGFWALSRHADVLAGLKDHERLSNTGGVALEQSTDVDPTVVMSFLGMDPPEHDRMRSMVSRGFTPRRIDDLEPLIRELAVYYLDRFSGAGRCEFIGEFAGKLPMDVISEMLGVPQADRDTLREWADRVLHREEGVAVVPPSAIESSARLLSYFADLVKERRQRLGPDLVSALLEAEIEGERLGDRDVIAFLFLMIIAGNETTTKLLANALYWLAKNPGERDKLRRDPSLIPRWVEETLRFDNSSQALARTVTTEMELHGRVLQPGEKVLLIIGAANRDERVFPDPDRYDILRDTSHSLHFGKGSHFCLGAALARLEARVSLEELWRRLPDYEVDESALTRVHSANVRGFSTFPIEFAAASG